MGRRAMDMPRTLTLSGVGGTVVIRRSACGFVSDFVSDFLAEGSFTVPFTYAALKVVAQFCAEANQVSVAPSLDAWPLNAPCN